MARKKMKEKDKQQFQNVGLIKEDHDLLRKLAQYEQWSMARQLSVLIRKAVAVPECDLRDNAGLWPAGHQLPSHSQHPMDNECPGIFWNSKQE